jgi:hypothetical protein
MNLRFSTEDENGRELVCSAVVANGTRSAFTVVLVQPAQEYDPDAVRHNGM